MWDFFASSVLPPLSTWFFAEPHQHSGFMLTAENQLDELHVPELTVPVQQYLCVGYKRLWAFNVSSGHVQTLQLAV